MICKNKPAAAAWRTDCGCFRWCVLALILCILLIGLGAQAADKSTAADPTDPVQVVGRWQRTDGGYILDLRDPTFDGRLTATYFNPQPINVARSGWALKDGHLLVLVELRDKGYPGSTYTLAYQQDSDRLAGIYFQAAVQQQFEVVFERIE
jgi:hypothetical protein